MYCISEYPNSFAFVRNRPSDILERLSRGTCTCTCNRRNPHQFCVLHHQFCSAFRSTRSEKLVEWRPHVGKNL